MPLRRNRVTYSKRPNHAARAAHARGDKAFRTYDTSYIRPKRSRVPHIIGAIVLILILGLIVWAVASFVRGCGATEMLPEGQSAEIVVAEGESAQQIAKSLSDAGLIENPSDFTARVSALGVESKLKPGTYTIAGGTSIDDIISLLQVGGQSDTFTIPEGSTLAQTAAIVAEASGGAITEEDFMAQAADASVYAPDYPFVEAAGTQSLEGFLFPKTYAITQSSTADALIRTMLDQFQKETANLDYSYAESHGLTPYDVLKLAAIVEKEAAVDNRATVASVFYNRLAEGMRIQSDETVAYFAGHDPTPADVETENPYNTYTNSGLTPTPINSPSLECLQAVCAPEETNYLYFYFAEDENGTMQYYFSETYEDHKATYE